MIAKTQVYVVMQNNAPVRVYMLEPSAAAKAKRIGGTVAAVPMHIFRQGTNIRQANQLRRIAGVVDV